VKQRRSKRCHEGDSRTVYVNRKYIAKSKDSYAFKAALNAKPGLLQYSES
jgi:hypothetical protein